MKDQKRDTYNLSASYKALLTEELKLTTYTEAILCAVCNYYIALAYEGLRLNTDAYLSFKKGFAILAKTHESAFWSTKFISKLTKLKEMLKVGYQFLYLSI